MVTKYNTGDSVLIPATISSAEEQNGVIIYHVEAELWNGVPEDAIILNEDAKAQSAMETFASEFATRNDWR